MSREREKKIYVITDRRDGAADMTWGERLRGAGRVIRAICGAIVTLIGAAVGTRKGIGRELADLIRDEYRGRAGQVEADEDKDEGDA